MYDIMDYLDSLEIIETHRTWLRCVCPVCGDTNLKINIKSPFHYYKCWSNHCNIQAFLSGKSPPPSPYVPTFQPHTQSILLEKLSQEDFYTLVPYNPPKRNGNQTTYCYPEFSIFRYDTPNKKYFDLSAVPNTMYDLPVYGLEYIENESFAIWVEGEKTASAGHAKGLKTFTILTTCINDDDLSVILKVLYNRGLRKLLILPDNDKVGEKKASLIETYAWRNKIATKTINLFDLFLDYIDKSTVKVSGFDLADLLQILDTEKIVRTICQT